MAEFLISAFADEASDDLDGQLAALKRNRVRCIEPRSINGGVIDKTDDELYTIRERLDAEGIGLSALGSPIGKYGIDEPFEPYLASFQRALNACRILGTSRMRIFSFFVPKDRLRECRDEVLRRLTVLLEEADKAGVRLCHENESKIYGEAPEQVADLLQSLPGLYGIFDAANYVRNGHDPIEGIEATLPRIEYLHVKDALFAGKTIVPVGKGDGGYREALRRVDAATDRCVFLTVEPHLHIFKQYEAIDSHKLNTGVSFQSSDDAFDCAVTSLKELLTELGYQEGEDFIWRK